MMNELRRKMEESKKYLEAHIGERKPSFAVVFGTGLAEETLKHLGDGDYIEIPYASIPHFTPAVKFHEGKMIFAKISGKDVVLMAGRAHYYEGHGIQEVVYPIHVLRELGIENILITSAVGGVNPDLEKKDLMLLEDQINITGINALIGYDDSLGPRFLPCADLYNRELRQVVRKICEETSIGIKEGVMYWLPGPSFETRADLKAIRALGGDTIGWSTVPEAIVAHYRGMGVIGINCITDSLNFDEETPLEEIIENAREGSKKLYQIIRQLVLKV